jgi:hypothetical protein
MPTDADRQALLGALTRFRAIADAFKSVDRVMWADTAIAKIGVADEQGLPVAGNIHEPTHLRNEIAKVIKVVELYNTAANQSHQAAA